jgi:hypothetical protein
MNYLPGLASNHDPPNFILPSSKDYKREPPALSSKVNINITILLKNIHLLLTNQ